MEIALHCRSAHHSIQQWCNITKYIYLYCTWVQFWGICTWVFPILLLLLHYISKANIVLWLHYNHLKRVTSKFWNILFTPLVFRNIKTQEHLTAISEVFVLCFTTSQRQRDMLCTPTLELAVGLRSQYIPKCPWCHYLYKVEGPFDVLLLQSLFIWTMLLFTTEAHA